MACAADGCLVAYGQTIGGSPMVIATRLDTTGRVLGKVLLSRFDDLNAKINQVQVASNGVDYLVYSYVGRRTVSSGPSDLHQLQIVDALGAVRATRSNLWSPGYDDYAVIAGGTPPYLVGHTPTSLLLDSQLNQVATSQYGSKYSETICGGNGRYLVVDGRNQARIIDGATGVAGKTLSYWNYGGPFSRPVAFWANGIFYLFATHTGSSSKSETLGIRIDAANNTVIDADDEFNHLPGGTAFCQDCGNLPLWATSFGGTGLVSVDGNLFRFDLATFARLGAGTGPELQWKDLKPVGLHSFGATLLGLDGGNVDVLAFQADPFAINLTGKTIAIPYIPDMTEPAAAYAGSRFMVAAREMIPSLVDPSGGVSPLPAAGKGGQVASNGNAFLLTHADESNALTAQRVGIDGALGEPHTLSSPTGYYVVEPKLTSDNRTYLLTGRTEPSIGVPSISGIRLDQDGNFLDQGQGLFSGTHYGVLADTVPDPTRRTFGIFAVQSNLQWVRLRSDTGVLITPANGFGSDSGPPAYASDGSFFAAIYRGEKGIMSALMDPASGGVLAGYPLVRSDIVGSQSVRAAWFDGRSYLVATATADAQVGDANKAFLVRRYSRTMDPLEATTFEPIPDKLAVGLSHAVALASDGNGNSLLAYQFADLTYGGVTMKGVFLHNDAPTGGPSPSLACNRNDSVELGDMKHEEGRPAAAGNCDPLADVTYAAGKTHVINAWDEAANGSYANRIEITLVGDIPTAFPASYPISATSADKTATVSVRMTDGSGATTQSCDAVGGSAYISAYGAVEEIVKGSFLATGWSGIGCTNLSLEGLFTITRSQ